MINTANGMANLKQQPTAQIINAIPIQTTTTTATNATSAPQIATAIANSSSTNLATAITVQSEASTTETSASTAQPPVEPVTSEAPLTGGSDSGAKTQEPSTKENTNFQQTLATLVTNMNEAVESGTDAISSLSSTSGVLKASGSIERLNEVINV